jgi:hypothetical protein
LQVLAITLGVLWGLKKDLAPTSSFTSVVCANYTFTGQTTVDNSFALFACSARLTAP